LPIRNKNKLTRNVDAERLGNLRGLRDPGGFHDDGVELALGREVRDGLDEVGAQRAAHAPVLQLHQPRFVAIQRAGVADQGAVDVERRDVVDDDGDAKVSGVLHDALEQRGLTGAEESGEEGHGDRGLHGHVVAQGGGAQRVLGNLPNAVSIEPSEESAEERVVS
jgi:hypothetical protein